jgi:D-glycero-beta-D-manno-heptose 1-phosphate adenylyltransferase
MLYTLPELIIQRNTWRAAGQRLVFTNGVFDLLHYGHLHYLSAARALGDLLVIGLNSDQSTHQIKGPLRPLIPEAERAALLAALRPVDGVIVFNEPTAEQLIATLQPDLYVKGGDYTLDPKQAGSIKPLPEAAVVQRYGGQVQLLQYLPNHSTTDLITLIKERYAAPSGSLGTS